jgi:hypothetical protein
MYTYCMTPTQSDDWTLGGTAATQVAETIAECLAAVGVVGTTLVLVDDGSIAFTLETGGAL